MNSKRFFVAFLLALPLLIFAISLPAQASPAVQEFPSPTPGTDGRIIYVVQAGDSCFRIQALYGVTVDQLRSLNPELDENCTIAVGEELVLGSGGPGLLSPTPGPSPTPEPPTVTPTPPPGTTEICVLLYEDLNGDAQWQEGETGIASGAVSISNTAGTYSDTKATISEIDPDLLKPVQTCFTDVPAGEYNISLAVPAGYNPTTELTSTFAIKSGGIASVSFGAQAQKETSVEQPAEDGGSGPSPIFGILGGLLLLGGLGLGWYAFRQRKSAGRPKSNRFLR
jgi:LysM repeat protein